MLLYNVKKRNLAQMPRGNLLFSTKYPEWGDKKRCAILQKDPIGQAGKFAKYFLFRPDKALRNSLNTGLTQNKCKKNAAHSAICKYIND
jgi:hypothetical protein